MIQADIAEFVDENSGITRGVASQDIGEQGRFAAAEKTRYEGERQDVVSETHGVAGSSM
jgi:hypothetical protein